jgi:hypothetical protein
MYGRFKRRRAATPTRMSFAAKRRKLGAGAGSRRFLPTDGGKRLVSTSYAYRPQAGGNGNHTTAVIYRQPTWLPDRLQIPLKWTVSLTFSITSGVGAQAALVANSITDPGGSSSASQPYGYDILIATYGFYRVMAASLRTEWCLDQSGSATGLNNIWRQTVWPSLVNTSYVSDVPGATQQPYAKTAICATGNTTGSQGFAPQLNSYMSTAKIFGERPLTIQTDVSWGATLGSDPVQPWFFNIMCTAQNSAAALTTAIACNITMIQYTELSRRVPLSST